MRPALSTLGLWLLCAGTAVWSAYTVAILIADSCSASASTELDFISTRLAECLDTRPAEVWSLVYCVEFQIMLLLSVWRRLLLSYHVETWLWPWVVSFGVCFVTSFAMVVEFRNDRKTVTRRVLGLPAVEESTLHVYAAVTTMISLTLLHACMCYGQLRLGAHQAELARSKLTKLAAARPAPGSKADSIDWKLPRSDETARDGAQTDLAQWTQYQRALNVYQALDWVYLVCVAVFFLAWWVSNSSDSTGMHSTAVLTEWVVLLLAVIMHVYALMQFFRPLSWAHANTSILAQALHSVRGLASCEHVWQKLWICGAYVLALLYTLLIFALAPLAASEDTTHSYSSIMLLLAVITAYVYAALLLVS